MSNARNLGNVGARLQQTQSVGLSAGGNIKAVTFQGSGRLLTDLLQLTGGNIIIPVGSTRTYKNVYTAFNSISALLFDDDASVTFKLDPETINEPYNLDLSHPSGNVISISGSSLEWQSVQTNGTTVSPVKGVSGTNVIRLSAEIDFDTNYNIPAVGDYITIATVSARDVRGFNGHDRIVNGIMLLNYSAEVNSMPMNTMGASTRPVQVGDAFILTYPRNGASTISEYRTLSGFALYQESPTLSSTAIYFNEPAGTFTGTFRHEVIAQVGTPTSYRGSGRTISQLAGSTTITLLNGGVADSATNTFLNPGDVIHAMGQMRIVQTVGASNTCTINYPFRTGTGSGWTDALTTVPYLISTPGAQRYRGLHRVVRVVANRVTIEMLDYGFRTVASSPVVAYGAREINSMLPPIFGISSLGHPVSYPQTYTPQYAMSRSVFFKSVLNFTSSTFVKNNACMYLKGNFEHLDSFCMVCLRAYPYVGIVVGTDSDDQQPSKINLGVFGGGLGLYGFWMAGVASAKNTITNGYNLNYTTVYSNYPDVGTLANSNPIYNALTSITNITPPYDYPLKQSFNSILGNIIDGGISIVGSDAASSGNILGFVARSITSSVYTPGTISVGALVGCSTFYINSYKNLYYHRHITCTDNNDGYGNSIFYSVHYGECFFQTNPIYRSYATNTGWMIYCMLAAVPASYDHSFQGYKNSVFYDMGGLGYVFPYYAKDNEVVCCYITGGTGGVYFYYSNMGFSTGADGGNNPGQYWYFMYSPVAASNNNVSGVFAKLNTNDLITNCTYGGSILNTSITDSKFLFNQAVRSGNTTDSTRQQGSLGTTISVGLNTTTGTLVQY